ncbi:glycoside hydrolase superfamily [Xylaria telfairii]|nr:glycoside hydrolase superfamily [Xylaria telfairii]
MLSILAFGLWLLSTTFVNAAYNSTIPSNLAVYWGQNSVGGTNSQRSLIQVCRDDPDVDIILLAFLTSAANIDGGLNFANSYRPTQEEINECQSKHHKILLLSLGGAVTDNTWSFATHAEAMNAANRIWAAFGPASMGGQGTARPFGLSSVNGFDLDFEAPYSNTHVFAQRLRALMNEGTAAGHGHFYLTAAPQCPFPDKNLDTILYGPMATILDFVFIQFYNNPGCDLRTADGFEASLSVWHSEWAKKTGTKIFIGVPGAPTAIGPANRDSYIEGSALAAGYIQKAQELPSFAGLMIWDISQVDSNANFLAPIVDALSQPLLGYDAHVKKAPANRRLARKQRYI